MLDSVFDLLGASVPFLCGVAFDYYWRAVVTSRDRPLLTLFDRAAASTIPDRCRLMYTVSYDAPVDVGLLSRRPTGTGYKTTQSIFPKIAPPVGIPTPDVTSA